MRRVCAASSAAQSARSGAASEGAVRSHLMKKNLEVAFVLLERLRPGDWQRTLAWAALVGITGALATLGFRAALGAIETLLYGTGGGLVHAACRSPRGRAGAAAPRCATRSRRRTAAGRGREAARGPNPAGPCRLRLKDVGAR